MWVVCRLAWGLTRVEHSTHSLVKYTHPFVFYETLLYSSTVCSALLHMQCDSVRRWVNSDYSKRGKYVDRDTKKAGTTRQEDESPSQGSYCWQ